MIAQALGAFLVSSHESLIFLLQEKIAIYNVSLLAL